jgi:hypothetical protein
VYLLSSDTVLTRHNPLLHWRVRIAMPAACRLFIRSIRQPVASDTAISAQHPHHVRGRCRADAGSRILATN